MTRKFVRGSTSTTRSTGPIFAIVVLALLISNSNQHNVVTSAFVVPARIVVPASRAQQQHAPRHQRQQPHVNNNKSSQYSSKRISCSLQMTFQNNPLLVDDSAVTTATATITTTTTATTTNNDDNNDSIRPVRPITQRTRFQGLLALTAIITASNYGGNDGNVGLQFHSIPVAESLLALIASIVLVSGATDAVERVTAEYAIRNGSMPSYNIGEGEQQQQQQRFNQEEFGGRFFQMLLACDPRLLLYTEEEVRRYRALAYEEYKDVKARAATEMTDGAKNEDTVAHTDRILWEAKRIADSALHPQTQEWIPRPFRMSGYLPFNGPICIAMISVSATLPLLFWSWMNQSQNALVNYFNGPRMVDDSNNKDDRNVDATLLKSYAIAVASTLVITFGLATYIQTHYSDNNPEQATQLLRFISFPSAVIASSLNCYIVRSPEIDTGVPLLNAQMENVLPGQTSYIAAKRGVYSTTASRAVLQMPTYFIPPLILDAVAPLREYLSEHSMMVVPMTTFLLLVSFGIGLPCAVGLFPQVSSIKVEDVEEKFGELGYEEFYYNKGL